MINPPEETLFSKSSLPYAFALGLARTWADSFSPPSSRRRITYPNGAIALNRSPSSPCSGTGFRRTRSLRGELRTSVV